MAKQNNEGINNLIWKHCLKNIHVVLTVLEIGTASAVINLNNGLVRMLRVLAKLSITHGNNSVDYCNKRDAARIYQMNRKKTDSVKHQHKQMRAM